MEIKLSIQNFEYHFSFSMFIINIYSPLVIFFFAGINISVPKLIFISHNEGS